MNFSNMSGEMVSRDRRSELLALSRQSRAKWVMSASWEDLSTRRELMKGSGDVQKGSVTARIPMTESIKTVLDYLSFISNDGDFLDVQSLAMSLPDSGRISSAQEYGDESEDDEIVESDDESALMSAKDENAMDNTYSQISILKEINAATGKQKESLESKSDIERQHSTEASNQEKNVRSNLENCSPEEASGIPFLDFLKLLKRQIPEVLSIVKSMQSFVAKIGVESVDANIKFDSERTQEDRHKSWSREIAIFVADTQAQMRVCLPWANEAEGDWKQTCLFVEKFMHIKLHPILFCQDSSVEAQDVAFYQRLQALDFLTPEHLDIKSLKEPSNESASSDKTTEREASEWGVVFNAPVSHLRDLEQCRTPQDMIACLKTVTVSIATVLKAALGGGEDPGADELLPMMILTLVRVKPEKMYSVLSYVNNYTSDLKMDSESGYLITQLMSAVQFLSELDASRITIATDDFEKKMLKCQEEAKVLTLARFSTQGDQLHLAAHDSSLLSHVGSGKEQCSPSIFSSQIEEDSFVSSFLDCNEDDFAMLGVMSRFTRKAKRSN